jgi:hypothetical protein
MAKMTLSRARSLIGEIVLARLDRAPDPLDATNEAARTVIIRWLVDALDAGQLRELAALLTVDFVSWPAMLKGTPEGGSPGHRAGEPPAVSRTAADDGRHLTARTLCQPGENGTVFRPEALAWPLLPDSDNGGDGGDGWDDLEATRAALLAYLDAVTWGQSGSTGDERKALFELIAARLFEVGTLVVAGYTDAAAEMAEELEALDELLPPQPGDKDIPF